VQLELQAMKHLDHPNIIKLVDLKETLMFIFMIIEYCSGGDLLKHVQAKERVSEVSFLKVNLLLLSSNFTLLRKKLLHSSVNWFLP